MTRFPSGPGRTRPPHHLVAKPGDRLVEQGTGDRPHRVRVGEHHRPGRDAVDLGAREEGRDPRGDGPVGHRRDEGHQHDGGEGPDGGGGDPPGHPVPASTRRRCLASPSRAQASHMAAKSCMKSEMRSGTISCRPGCRRRSRKGRGRGVRSGHPEVAAQGQDERDADHHGEQHQAAGPAEGDGQADQGDHQGEAQIEAVLDGASAPVVGRCGRGWPALGVGRDDRVEHVPGVLDEVGHLVGGADEVARPGQGEPGRVGQRHGPAPPP